MALEAESYMGVDAGGDADVGVAEEFALAESGAQGEFVQRVQTITGGRLEELLGLGGGEGLEASGAGRGGLDVVGDVARQFVLARGVFQGGLVVYGDAVQPVREVGVTVLSAAATGRPRLLAAIFLAMVIAPLRVVP